jgi:hypothetical protein
MNGKGYDENATVRVLEGGKKIVAKENPFMTVKY